MFYIIIILNTHPLLVTTIICWKPSHKDITSAHVPSFLVLTTVRQKQDKNT